jgi:hypothetical protein
VLCCAVPLYRYETWRRHRLSRPKVGSKIRNFALSTLVPVALAFYCAKNGVDMETVSQGIWRCGMGVQCGVVQQQGRQNRDGQTMNKQICRATGQYSWAAGLVVDYCFDPASITQEQSV